MKKQILTLTLAILSVCAFSQIKYELKSWAINGIQKVSADSVSYDVPIIVTVGIVGDIYDFCSLDISRNMFKVNLPFKVSQSEKTKYAYITQQATIFVAKQYPDK